MTDWLIEAARRLIDLLPELPDGLTRENGVIMFECISCHEWVEWPAEIADFDLDNPNNMCGGSPRCCP